DGNDEQMPVKGQMGILDIRVRLQFVNESRHILRSRNVSGDALAHSLPVMAADRIDSVMARTRSSAKFNVLHELHGLEFHEQSILGHCERDNDRLEWRTG